MPLSFEKRIYGSFGLAVICLIIIGFITINFANRYLHLYQWEKNSYYALQQIDELTMDILQIEKYLHDYHEDTSAIQYSAFLRSVDEFKQTLSIMDTEDDDSIIRGRLNAYQNMINATFTTPVIDSISPEFLHSNKGFSGRNRIIVQQFNIVNALQEDFNKIDEQLTSELSQRSMMTEKSLRRLIVTLLVFVLLTISTLVMFLYRIRLDLVKRRYNEEKIRNSEKRLRALNQQKDKFVSIITHDLRSPFSGLLGFTELLKETAGNNDPSKLSFYASKVDDTAKALYELLNRLLDWFRVESGKMPFKPEPLDLKRLTGETLSLMRSNADNKEITILNNIPDIITACADRVMTETIIRNLLSNAIKFSSAGKNVEITADNPTAGNHVTITVKDYGVGMDEQTLGSLFNFETHKTRMGTSNEAGAGLGLLLTKELVEKQGGEIQVESRKGEGTSFIFTLPACLSN